MIRRVACAFALLAAIPLLAQTPGSGTGGGQGNNQSATATAPSSAQIACLPQQQSLIQIPELVADPMTHRLRGTVITTAEQDRITFRYPLQMGNPPSATQPGQPGSFTACFPQWVRAFRSPEAVPAYGAKDPKSAYLDPMHGPTLRARVGDIIELTFLNEIEPNVFGQSIDRGDEDACDQANTYPGTGPNADKYPNCFHGSTTANIHFHGTHTNPNTTGDNVFIEVLSQKRLRKEAMPDRSAIKEQFDKFFGDCETALFAGTHVEWPRRWSDLPEAYRLKQKQLLMDFDEGKPQDQKLWPVNEAQLAEGAWPQYYMGASPYCFRLPPDPDDPGMVSSPGDHQEVGGGGAGSAEMHPGHGVTTGQTGAAEAHKLVMGQAPGTHWYHAHKHGSTTIDLLNGFSGAFIIEGKYDDQLNEYYAKWEKDFTRKVPVMVINQWGTVPKKVTRGGPDKGPDFSVNGRMNPTVTMRPGEVQMWRIVNASSRAGVYFNAPGSGMQWRQIAQDGVQFSEFNYGSKRFSNNAFLLAAGNRADLLVMAPPCANKAGCTVPVIVNNEVDPSDLTVTNPPSFFPITLMTVKVSGTAMDPAMDFKPTAPTFPPFLADIKDDELTGTKTIEFATNPQSGGGAGGPGIQKIDGKQFDGEVGVVALLNTAEEWTIKNATVGISHPFHIHINPFQVTQVFDPNATLANGQPAYITSGTPSEGQCLLNPDKPETWKPCTGTSSSLHEIWWDVFPIPSGMTVKNSAGNNVLIPGFFKMRSRFVDYSGYYVIHCHILAHEDRGMMTVVEVAPLRSPYSHH
ncbi:MAG TPA: multicopper oxidase domain-containing protein [Thermoanaerobaculia bacterium]|nr:multicopper oxidase domain-containing protein [Thermoanaerobaculia bacterium]